MGNRTAKQITVKKHDDIVITCEADAPIHWTDAWSVFPSLWAAPFAWNFQESELYTVAAKLNDGKFILSYDDIHLNETYRYKSILSLSDVDSKSVGFYFCVKNSSTFSAPNELYSRDEAESNVKSKAIYLSVEGSELGFRFLYSSVELILFAISDNDFPIKLTHDLWIWDSCKVDVPCIPTVHNEPITVMVNDIKMVFIALIISDQFFIIFYHNFLSLLFRSRLQCQSP